MEHSNFVYVIKQLELGLRPLFFEACDKAGITGAQYTALTVLLRHPGVTSSELARRSFVKAQTMAVTLDPLIESGFIRRETQTLNGRKIQLFITQKGEELIEQLSPHIDQLENELVSDLNEIEREQLSDFLRRCRHSLDKTRSENSTV